MGWGACTHDILVERRRPSSFVRPSSSPDLRRPHCREFHWNIASAVSKTVCLSLFLLAEAPRRLHALALRAPEPAPRFSCASAGGYRVCACGHHYYDHGNDVLVGGVGGAPGDDKKLEAMIDAYGKTMDEKEDGKSIVIRTGKRRKRWFRPWGRKE